MALKVFNTLTGKKEEFVPIVEGQVKMYCCGPTVYDFLHVGNFRGAVFYNLVAHWLRESGYDVEYAYNFTDVDDKIINRAEKESKEPKEIAETYIKEFKKDFAALSLMPHTHNPKVTDHIPQIIHTIETLVSKGHAYEAEGDVLYSIQSFPEYGKLSGRKVEDLLSGVRIEVDTKKKNPLDFALWKSAKSDEQGWESPWGKGRPGWHIECTSMIQSLFGEQIDIHGGGLDLAFPHHENEIAQAEGCSGGKTYAKYWLHNNMFTFDGAKMSKSLGNIRTMRSFLEHYNGEIFKYLVLSVHYRSEAEFSDATIHQSIKGLAKFYSALSLAAKYLANSEDLDPKKNEATPFQQLIEEANANIKSSLNEDFNTPEMFARFFEITRQFNSEVKRGQKANPKLIAKCALYRDFIVENGRRLSLFQETPEAFLLEMDNLLLKQMNLERAPIDQLVEDRWLAKKEKDYQKADSIRQQLDQMGISVQDTADGSYWEVTK